MSLDSIRTNQLFAAALTACFALAGILAATSARAQTGPLPEFAEQFGGTEVQKSVAQAIQSICPRLIADGGGLGNVLESADLPGKDITLRCNELVQTSLFFLDGRELQRYLGYTDSDDLLTALQEVTGEEISSQGTLTARASNSQLSNIGARMAAIRTGGTAAAATGAATAFNFNVEGTQYASANPGLLGPALGGGASADSDSGLARLGWFVTGNYNTGEKDESDLEDGFDFDAFGVTAGVDYRFDSGVIGASIGYDDYEADFDTSSVVSGGEITADGFSVSAFALKEFGDFYVDGIATFGQLDYEMSRILRYDSNRSDANDPLCQCPDQDRNIVSESDTDHYAVSINAGWQNYVDSWLIQPAIGLSYREYEIDGYRERDTTATGGMELRYGDQKIESMRSIVGIQVSRAINRSFGVLRPTFSAEWYHEFEDDGSEIRAKYSQEDVLAGTADPSLGFSTSLADCLSCFVIRGEDPDSDYGVIGAGIALVFPNFVQLLFHYEGLVGYEDLTSHAFTVSLRGQF